MATRNLLARTHLPAFRAWLAERGWVEQPVKGAYEVGRWTHEVHFPLILYARARDTVHYTVPDNQWDVVRRFIKDRDSQKAGA
ncbi:MAG: hypothetical protein HEQ38_17170 [Gemmatimonas sp.]|nr:hypothetical protein [Gemmatimonas sp.]